MKDGLNGSPTWETKPILPNARCLRLTRISKAFAIHSRAVCHETLTMVVIAVCYLLRNPLRLPNTHAPLRLPLEHLVADSFGLSWETICKVA